MDTIVEMPLAPAEPLPATKPTVFTPATASEMGKRSAAKRAIQREQARIESEQRKLNPQPAVQSTAVNDDSYRLERLRITREQLSGLDKDLKAAEDEKGKKAICDAIARLSEVERQLAGRPAPGSLRPAQSKAKRATPESYGPVE